MSRWGRHCNLLCQVEHRRQGQPCEHRGRSQSGAAGGWGAEQKHTHILTTTHDSRNPTTTTSLCFSVPQVKSCQVWTHWAASKHPIGLLRVCVCVNVSECVNMSVWEVCRPASHLFLRPPRCAETAAPPPRFNLSSGLCFLCVAGWTSRAVCWHTSTHTGRSDDLRGSNGCSRWRLPSAQTMDFPVDLLTGRLRRSRRCDSDA